MAAVGIKLDELRQLVVEQLIKIWALDWFWYCKEPQQEALKNSLGSQVHLLENFITKATIYIPFENSRTWCTFTDSTLCARTSSGNWQKVSSAAELLLALVPHSVGEVSLTCFTSQLVIVFVNYKGHILWVYSVSRSTPIPSACARVCECVLDIWTAAVKVTSAPSEWHIVKWTQAGNNNTNAGF